MSSEQPGVLYLIPNTLGGEIHASIPASTLARLRDLRYLIAENPKNARGLLKAAESPVPVQSIRIERLDEHTPPEALNALLLPLQAGMDAGLVSDAGCPGIADPGAPLIRIAHTRGIRVVPMAGPSSIVLALMASGLSGQRFAFHGYLPVDKQALLQRLNVLEKASGRESQTQVFIETPYRNERMLRLLLQSLGDSTLLCVASDLTLATQSICTKSMRDWRQAGTPALDNHPSVFLFLASPGKTQLSEQPTRRAQRTSTAR